MASNEARAKAFKGLIANPEFVKEFYSRIRAVDHPDACWIWQGYIDKYGFGRVRAGKRTFGAHRVAYELEHGPISQATIIKQQCNCRACCRVDHLVATTRKRKDGKGSWKPYVDNLTSLTASIFEEDGRDLIGGVKVVFGDDPQVAVDKLSPLLRTLGEAVSRCVKSQTDILAAFNDSQAKLAAVPGLAERHLELIRTVERLEQLVEANVSRETSGPHHADVSRETSTASPGHHAHVSRETFHAEGTDITQAYPVKPAPGPDEDERQALRETLATLYHGEVGVPCDDPFALYEVYELALAHGGTQAGSLLRAWMQSFAADVEARNGVRLVSRFLSWAVNAAEHGWRVSDDPDDATSAGPAGPGASGPAPGASPATPDTPPPSSHSSAPHGAPAAPPPSPEACPPESPTP